MSQNTIIGIIIVIILALGGWYLLSPHTNTGTNDQAAQTATTTTDTQVQTQTPQTTGTTGNPQTFKSVLTQTGSYLCTFESLTGSTRGMNTVYIADGKLRAEFRENGTAGTSARLSVYNGRSLYVWKEGASVGTRTTINKLSDLPLVIPNDLTSGKVLGTGANNVSWDCHIWVTDQKILTPPTYVSFNS